MGRLRLWVTVLLCGAFASFLASAQPSGFQISTVWSGFTTPVAVRFTPAGRAFVMEKWGRVWTFDNINDTTPTQVIDLANDIWAFHDHGLLGLAIDPQFPQRPYIYVLHALRGYPGGRLLRITLNTTTMQATGSPLVLLEDWAQVYPSHSIGDLHFGPEGALYLTAGDGASYDFADWGQSEPHNPDASPLGGIDVPDPPLEGGALRSQDIRSTGDPLGFSGTLLRVDPDTGAAWPGNPLQGGATNDDRIIAYGLRNPYRFTIHPTNNSVWICDVGWNLWEELNRVPFPFTNPVPNFGWPAYEGVNPQAQYQAANLPLLQSLYAAGSATAPFYTYQHSGSASITGAAFYMDGSYPSNYRGSLFIGDYAVGWIKVMFPDANGNPNPANMQTFVSTGANVVDLQSGPGGEIYYVDISNNRVRRIRYLQGNNAPVAVAQPSVTSGEAPLTVTFTGSASFDPDPSDTLSFSWDLNGDDVFGDATTANAQYTYTLPGNYLVKLRVTDNKGASDTTAVTISVNNLPPVPVIEFPLEGETWRVGDVVVFSGSATDPETGAMPASQLSWEVVLHHCATLDFSDCHEHPVVDETGISEGEFLAIDHEYPCYVEIRLTATEPGPNGLSVTVSRELHPELTTLTLETNPPGLRVGAFSQQQAAPFVKDVIVNGQTAIATPSPQALNGLTYQFTSWSDGGAQSHNIVFGASPVSRTANFALQSGGNNEPPVLGPLWAQTVSEGSGLGFYITASDPDGPAPLLSATNLPVGARFLQQPNGSVYFEWFPQVGDAGNHFITITATDYGVPQMSVSGMLIIRVLSGNIPPNMDAVWSTTVNAGAFINLRIGAWDTDGDVPDLYAENLPPGAAYNDDGWGTGFLTWQTTSADVGVYTGIRVYAVDHGNPPLMNERVFTIRVLGSSNAPVIDSIPTSTVVAGDTLELNISASDPNGTIPVLTAQNLPNGATFTPDGNGNGVFNWPTTVDDVGNHSGIAIIATDSVTPSLEFKAMFNVRVVGTGSAPVLDPIGPKIVEEESQLQFNVTATDPDSGPPALGVIDLPIGATFIDNGNGTGTFTWTPETGTHENSPYLVTFVASDDTDSDSEVVEITVEHHNEPPHLETIGPKSGVEGELLEIPMHAHDHDGTIPTLSADNLPSGASFEDLGGGDGLFSWTPPAGAAAGSPYLVTFTAHDGELTHSETVTVTIDAANAAPVVAPFGPYTIAEEQVWSANVSASDPDGTTPVLSAPVLPAGASFVDHGNGTGTISWTPDANASQGSPYSATISASDGSLSDSKSSTITVTNTNHAPVMSVVGDKTIAENALLQFNVSATDSDGTVPTLSAQSLPTGATFANNGNGTGTFTWTPDFDAAGSSPYTVTFVASDGSLSDSKQSVITVTNTNRAPVMAVVGNKTVAENALLQFNVSANDPDGTMPTLSAQSLPSGAAFVNNGNGTGTFTWTPNFDAAASSPYAVTFVASDGALSDSKVSTITVTNTNRAPTMTAVGNKTVAENALLQFAVAASDPDETIPTLSAQTLPVGASFVNNGDGTGTFAWTPNFDAAAISPYTVTFVASDGTLSDSKASTITVTNTNRAPVMAAVGNRSVAAGQQLQFTVSASDPDGTTPALSALSVPSGASFVDNGNGTGTFTWTPTNGAVNQSPYTVTFTASDGTLSDSKTSVITVTATNQAPVMATVGNKSVAENALLQFNVSASDPDGTIPTLTAQSLPSGAAFVNNGNGTGTFTWTPGFDAAASSPYTVTFVASDGSLSDSKQSVITVTNTNRAPVMAVVGDKSAVVGQLLQFNVSASDPDGTVPTLSAQSLPSGASFSNNGNGTGTFSWTPGSGAVTGSPYTVSFTASDGTLSDTKSSVITVTTSANQPPVFQTIWARQVTAGGSGVGFYITAIDPDGGAPVYSSPALPAGARLIQFPGNSSVYFEWFPTSAQVGTHNIPIVATDAGTPPMSGNSTIVIYVLGGNVAPMMDAVYDQTVVAGAFVNMRIGAWDTDGDNPSLAAFNLPPGANYTSDGFGTGFFTWQTNASHVGVHSNITIVATDHGSPPLSNQRVFKITVLAP